MDGKGDERYLPYNDQGPVRRYIRDFVDSRFAIGELFMPIVLAFLILSIERDFAVFNVGAAVIGDYRSRGDHHDY